MKEKTTDNNVYGTQTKKWYPSENSPQGAWDRIAEDMLLEFAKSGHPIFRATTPLSRGKLKSKGKGKVSIHFSATNGPQCGRNLLFGQDSVSEEFLDTTVLSLINNQ